jgi:asparagine synthase (glutamine-hydrolysing)
MVQYALYKKAAEMGFKVILSGLGGDELFYSYKARHREAEAIRLRHEFNQLYPVRKHWKKYLRFMMKHYKHILLPNHPARIDESMLVEWTCDDYKRFALDASLDGECFGDIDVHVSLPENVTIQGMYDYITPRFAINMCVYLGNKLCEANGIELRCPILSPELVQFMDSLPMDMKFDIDQPKCFQKEMMAGIIPDYILYARKRGFEPPFEFIRQMAANYQYQHIQATHCFFNSMMADQLVGLVSRKSII